MARQIPRINGFRFAWEDLNWENPEDPFAYRRYYDIILSGLRRMDSTKRFKYYRNLCCYDTYFLGRYVNKQGFLDIPYAWQLCAEADYTDFETVGGLDQTMWMIFREGFKTTTLTHNKTIQQLCRIEDVSKLLLSNTAPGAKMFLKSIMIELEKNEDLHAYFPDRFYTDPKKEAPKDGGSWSLDRGIFIRRTAGCTKKEPSVFASGLVDGSLSKVHFDIIEADDAVTEESVTTDEQIKKTDDAIMLSQALGTNIETPESDLSIYYYVGTRYHDADSYGKLMKTGDYRLFLKPWHTGDEKTPRAHTPERVARLKRQMSSYIFNCQYNLDPTPTEERIFKSKPATYDKLPGNLDYVLLVDPASGSKKDREHDLDNTSMNVIGRDMFGNEYWADGLYDNALTLTMRIQAVFDFVMKYGIRQVWYEKVGMQADTQEIERMKAQTGQYGWTLNEFNPKKYGSKRDRIERGLMPRVEHGILQIPNAGMLRAQKSGEMVDLCQIFLNELERFPFGEHDDLSDCMAQMLAVPPYGTDASQYAGTAPANNEHKPRNPKKQSKLVTSVGKWI